jgi:hypothetical protein
MPRVKGQTESRSAWFRQYFRSDRKNLKKKTAEVREAWEADHPGQLWTPRHNSTLANVKSTEKSRLRKRRKNGVEDEAGGEAPARGGRTAGGGLEGLELSIDACLNSARGLAGRDPDMEKVSKLLRAARNQVILIAGK